jgi:hypothetical protein
LDDDDEWALLEDIDGASSPKSSSSAAAAASSASTSAVVDDFAEIDALASAVNDSLTRPQLASKKAELTSTSSSSVTSNGKFQEQSSGSGASFAAASGSVSPRAVRGTPHVKPASKSATVKGGLKKLTGRLFSGRKRPTPAAAARAAGHNSLRLHASPVRGGGDSAAKLGSLFDAIDAEDAARKGQAGGGSRADTGNSMLDTAAADDSIRTVVEVEDDIIARFRITEDEHSDTLGVVESAYKSPLGADAATLFQSWPALRLHSNALSNALRAPAVSAAVGSGKRARRRAHG